VVQSFDRHVASISGGRHPSFLAVVPGLAVDYQKGEVVSDEKCARCFLGPEDCLVLSAGYFVLSAPCFVVAARCSIIPGRCFTVALRRCSTSTAQIGY
jgi:hypothetical protein